MLHKKTGPKPEKKPVDLNQFEQLAAIGCTQEEIAGHFGICVETLEARIKKNYFKDDNTPMKLSEAISMFLNSGNCQLKISQWKRAKAGSDRMLEWLGKCRLGQRDRLDITTQGDKINDAPVYNFDGMSLDKQREIRDALRAARQS